VTAPAQNHGSLESLSIGSGRGQRVVKSSDFSLEKYFCLVALWRKGIKDVGEAVVERCQLGDPFGRNGGLDTRDFKSAIKCYSSILREQEDAVALANRALANWELDQFARAQRDYLCAVSLNPKDDVALRNLGELLLKRNRPSEAITYLTRQGLRPARRGWDWSFSGALGILAGLRPCLVRGLGCVHRLALFAL